MTPPILQSVHTPPLDHVRAGDQLVIATNARNCGEMDQPFLAIIEVRSSDGVTENLGWQSGVLKGNGQTQIGISWIPIRGDNYEIRAFAVSDFDNPEVLSPIGSSQVTIASAQSTFPLIVGNKTFDVQYSFSSSDGMMQDMRMHPSYPSIVADVFVAHDTTVDIVLPRKLLERMEIESGYHYCVGNGFSVFVKEVPIVFDQRHLDDMSQILTIPLSSGSNTIEIVGDDLLQYPPTCLHVGLEHYSFAKDLPGVQVDTWNEAVVIARDYLDHLAQSNGEREEEEGVVGGGPVGSVELVYVHNNGTAFTLNRYDGLLEDVYQYFNYTPRDSYYWIVTLNREQDYEKAEYILIIDAQTGEVRDLSAVD